MQTTIKTVPITLDKARHLRYDMNALIALGEALEINLLTQEGWDQLVGRKVDHGDGTEGFIAPRTSFRQIRAIIWAGLLHEDETLTERQVGAMIDPGNMTAVIEAYKEAFSADEQPGPAPAEGEKAPLAEATPDPLAGQTVAAQS